jgi:NADH-quinone oxidoreductase subunit L
MHAMSGSGDIRKMGGLRKLTPWTHAVVVVCWLAICGVPIFSGFFSKDAIVAGAFATEAFGHELAWVGPTVGTILLLAALGTAFYMSRLYFLVFSGPSRADSETLHHIHESPPSMVGPLVVLAVGAGLGGLIGIPGGLFGHPEWNLLGHLLEPAVGAELEVPHNTELLFMGISTVLALTGIALAHVFYGGGYRAPAAKFAAAFPGFVQLVRDKFRVDELYGAVIIRPVRKLSVALFRIVDRVIIDQILVGGTAAVVDVLGRISRVFQAGDAQRYMAAFAIGAAALVFFATRPTVPSALKVVVTGTTVSVDAGRTGKASPRGLTYAFDFDDDGRAEVEGPSSDARYTYDKSGAHTIRVTVTDPRWNTKSSLKQKVDLATGEQK